jgi:hypothetical protein
MFIKMKAGSMDKLGIVASVACAIHCAALPLFITALPLAGMEFLANKWVEISMICLSVVVGARSLLSTYPAHKSYIPILILIFGFMLIGSGHFFVKSMEAVLVPLGGLSIAIAHYINWKLHLLSHNLTSCNTENRNPN